MACWTPLRRRPGSGGGLAEQENYHTVPSFAIIFSSLQASPALGRFHFLSAVAFAGFGHWRLWPLAAPTIGGAGLQRAWPRDRLAC
jgi:hypothetical protein